MSNSPDPQVAKEVNVRKVEVDILGVLVQHVAVAHRPLEEAGKVE